MFAASLQQKLCSLKVMSAFEQAVVMTTQKHCGTWDSPVTTSLLLQGARGISEVVPGDNVCWWVESRPSEGGRSALMQWEDGNVSEVTPPDTNVRTAVHEYGGGAWWVENRVVYYVDYADQRIRKLDTTKPGNKPQLLSPESETARGLRFADFRVTTDGLWLIAVCEKHGTGNDEPENLLVAVATNGSCQLITLASGADFYSSPCLSPDGTQIAWVQWNHPNMPWDVTELWQANLDSTESQCALNKNEQVAGGNNEAIVQPLYSPVGVLHYLSDKDNFWHVYTVASNKAVLEVDGDIGYPPWVFGLARYGFKNNGDILYARFCNGIEYLDGVDDSLHTQYAAFHSVRHGQGSTAYVGCSWSRESAVVFKGNEILAPRSLGLDAALLQSPETIRFPTDDGDYANALFFRPANPDYQPVDGEKPPLIVLAHGGPTSAARSHLNLARQFWTSRGFAVVDVNYRGSCGFGRAYRNKLYGNWGVSDVSDCVNAALFLADRGDVDRERLLIRGGSAGGYTVLCALAFHDVFAAGCSMYGVADLEALARDTHKFESRYLDKLVGPYPEAMDTYRERSPIHHLNGFNAPMIVLQGSEDAIVPPNQSRMIVEALDGRNIPVAYLEFEGEQHGFRKAENIKRALESELEFYLRVFGLLPAEEYSDLQIKHLD